MKPGERCSRREFLKSSGGAAAAAAAYPYRNQLQIGAEILDPRSEPKPACPIINYQKYFQTPPFYADNSIVAIQTVRSQTGQLLPWWNFFGGGGTGVWTGRYIVTAGHYNASRYDVFTAPFYDGETDFFRGPTDEMFTERSLYRSGIQGICTQPDLQVIEALRESRVPIPIGRAPQSGETVCVYGGLQQGFMRREEVFGFGKVVEVESERSNMYFKIEMDPGLKAIIKRVGGEGTSGGPVLHNGWWVGLISCGGKNHIWAYRLDHLKKIEPEIYDLLTNYQIICPDGTIYQPQTTCNL